MRTTVTRPAAARVSAAPDLLDWLRGLVSVAFVLLLPLLIIGTSLRGLVTDRDFMLRGFRDNQVAATTGLDDPQLERIADAFVAYFQAPPGQIQMQVTAFGQSRCCSTTAKSPHMEDVQALIQFFLRMQLVAPRSSSGARGAGSRSVVRPRRARARHAPEHRADGRADGAGRRAVVDRFRRAVDAIPPDRLPKRPVAAGSDAATT